uniref:Glycosyltransferase n=1 Tax=Linum usitatissimum TaxID=4006 RepID=I2BHD1_LINUS|nr:UDP-glycosyltransferase 1 [Linum usitatissimum]
MGDSRQHHVLIFPFMSKGHTIPILHLVHLLLRRQVAVTVITTPANRPFIAQSLQDTSASILQIPFPANLEGIPPGVESTDNLPSMSLFARFALATQLMQPDFERSLESLPPIDFIVSDGFLWWTLESSIKYGFPRLVFNGMCNYSICVFRSVVQSGILFGNELDDELIPVPKFPWIKVTKNDFESHVKNPVGINGPDYEFVMKSMTASKSSYGYVVNSFYELEPVFVDSFNNFVSGGPKAWCVGPLCLAKAHEKIEHQKPSWIQWLDEKTEQKSSVLFVAFGSQAKVLPDQLREISAGLEKSNVNFLWVTKEKESELGDGFEERVRGRGIVVREWVDQMEILKHPSVQGFVSHCGWNSVLEAISAGVPILAWPMMAEQHLNARMVVEELEVGIRVETSNGSVRGFVKWEGLEKTARELMEGEKGEEAKKKVMEYSTKAMQAMGEKTGSSWRTLDMLIEELCRKRT